MNVTPILGSFTPTVPVPIAEPFSTAFAHSTSGLMFDGSRWITILKFLLAPRKGDECPKPDKCNPAADF